MIKAIANSDQGASIIQLLKEHVAAVSQGWVIVPKALLPKAFNMTGLNVEDYPATVAIEVASFGSEIKKDILQYVSKHDLPREKANRALLRENGHIIPRERGWWKHESVLELAKRLPTYVPDDNPIASNLKAKKILHKDMNDFRVFDARSLFSNEDLSMRLRINLARLNDAVRYIEGLCYELQISTPSLMFDYSAGSSAGYKRIDIGNVSLQNNSARSSNAELAHEVAHVIMNHELYDRKKYLDDKSHRKSRMALDRQMERDADFLGVVIGKDPEGAALNLREYAAEAVDIAKAAEYLPVEGKKTPLEKTAEMLLKGYRGDEHPSVNARIRLFRDMAEEWKQAKSAEMQR